MGAALKTAMQFQEKGSPIKSSRRRKPDSRGRVFCVGDREIDFVRAENEQESQVEVSFILLSSIVVGPTRYVIRAGPT